MAAFLKYFQFTNQKIETSEITDAKEVIINLGSELKNNSMRVKLKNAAVDVFADGSIRHEWIDKDGTAKFRAIKATAGEIIDEELVDVFALWTETDPTVTVNNNDYLLMTGIINIGKVFYKEGNNYVELRCVDRNHVILNKLVIPQKFEQNDDWKAPLIIQRIVRHGVENSDDNALGFKSDGTSGRGSEGTEHGLLVDARLFSEGIKSTGTADGTATNKLINAGEDFVADGVVKDDWVRNTTDNTYAYVVSVDDSENLTLSKDIFVSGEGYEVSDGFIQDKRPDGTAFPDISFSQIDKPISESIAKLSQSEYVNTTAERTTADGLVVKRGCRYFVDKKNRFHWYVPSDSPEWIMKVGQTTNISPDTSNHKIIDVELSNEVINEVNYIIFNAGEDMDNIQISDFEYAQFSGRPILKDAKVNWEWIARDMKNEDTQAGNLSHTSSDTFAYSGGYEPMDGGNNFAAWDSAGATITDDADYNDKFKDEAILRGKSEARRIFAEQSNPRWNGKIQIRGESIIVGDLIDFTSDAHGLKNKLIRVNQVTHTMNAKEGWITVLNVMEDERERQIG